MLIVYYNVPFFKNSLKTFRIDVSENVELSIIKLSCEDRLHGLRTALFHGEPDRTDRRGLYAVKSARDVREKSRTKTISTGSRRKPRDEYITPVGEGKNNIAYTSTYGL